MYLIGYDIGSSSIKAALVDASSGQAVGLAQYPDSEMEIAAPQPGWAEQHPQTWWDHVCQVTHRLLAQHPEAAQNIGGIGIAYQMHGLVLIDQQHQVLRPSIIWCDSRAVQIGQEAFEQIGAERCLRQLLNSPGNFTASKLKWVKDNEPDVYQRIHKILLPGDYVALQMTGEALTTISGLSEGIFWDFEHNDIASLVLNQYGLDKSLIPAIAPAFGRQGQLTAQAAQALGLSAGIPVTYRAGDQPNNALSLGVLQPGEVAATGGTSGVVYGVVDKALYDPLSRVNGFAHVNHSAEQQRIGILLCINGSGIQYNWVRQHIGHEGLNYFDMEKMAAKVPVGADGLQILPFGNGAERMLNNQNPGALVANLQFNRHGKAHFYRAALEGIAFSFVYGMKIMNSMGLDVNLMRVGNDNLFQSAIFAQTIAQLVNSRIEIVKTTGAIGAARAAGVGAGYFASIEEAMAGNEVVNTVEPDTTNTEAYRQAYSQWEETLLNILA